MFGLVIEIFRDGIRAGGGLRLEAEAGGDIIGMLRQNLLQSPMGRRSRYVTAFPLSAAGNNSYAGISKDPDANRTLSPHAVSVWRSGL